MKKFAVIAAGGSGTRMHNTIPKQFLLLKEKPVLWYTIDAFIRAYNDIQIILVVHNEFIETAEQIAAMFEPTEKIFVTAAGATRFHSVQNGLKLVNKDSVVFVHDAVRCLVPVSLIQRCYNETVEQGSAVPCVAVTDSIRIFRDHNHYAADRNTIRIIQTPQTFLSNILLPAFDQEYQEAFTDEATVAESNGTKIFLTQGDYTNIKITLPIDLIIAEKILEQRELF